MVHVQQNEPGSSVSNPRGGGKTTNISSANVSNQDLKQEKVIPPAPQSLPHTMGDTREQAPYGQDFAGWTNQPRDSVNTNDEFLMMRR